MNFYIQDINEADAFADQVGESRWETISPEVKTKLISFASDDIEIMHGQERRQFNIPWQFGDVFLREACLHQLMFLVRVQGVREFVERAAYMSQQAFSDGIISLTNPGGQRFYFIAENLVKQVMNKSRVRQEFGFGRG